MNETPVDVIGLLLSMFTSFSVIILLYLNTSMILHCFYDDSIILTRKRILVTILGYIPTLLVLCVLSVLFGAVCGYLESKLDMPEMMTNDRGDVLLAAGSLPFLFWPAIMTAAGKDIRFRRKLLRFFMTMALYILLNMVSSLPCEMLRYCLTETGTFGKHLLDTQIMELVQIDCTRIVLLTVLMLLVYLRIYRKGITLRLRKTDVVSVLIYTVIVVLISFVFETLEKQEIQLAGGSAALRILLVLFMMMLLLTLPVLLVRNRLSASYQELAAYQQNFLEAELNASRQYKAAQEDTRAFRHDVQNNLTAVAMLMKSGKNQEAASYLNDMLTEVNALSPKIVSGDDMVDSLISAKLPKMAEHGITFHMDGIIEGGLNWKPMDICTVFANLLDNAIEAAARTKDGVIDLEFRKSEHHRLIRASNSCADDVDCEALMQSGSHFTSKDDKELHGYGIGNIRRTIEKNDGMMKVSCADHVFTMEIILPR